MSSAFKFKKFVFCFIGALIFFCPFDLFSKDYDYINIKNPSENKTPVAVTEFKVFNGSPSEISTGKEARKVLEEALNFTPYLQTMNSEAFFSNPAKTGIKGSEINFRDWTSIDADLLITGGVVRKWGGIRLFLRLFDTFNGKLIVGKTYTGARSNLRAMVHLFCNEISYHLTGRKGFFNTKIAFVSTVKDNKEIFTCDFDGKNVRQVTSHNNISLSPSLSSDGRWLAYVSYIKGKTNIVIKSLEKKKTYFVDRDGMNISPAWMPGRLNMAAALSFSGDQEIYLLTGKGEITKRITKSWGIDVSPDFSPKGDKMVFVSRRSGSPQIYIKNIRNGDVRRLTFKGYNNTSPSWSPDGREIAYVSISKKGVDIFVIDIESGIERQLTANTGKNEDPSWSPDGSMIVFTSTRERGVPAIFLMTARGADQRKLLSMNGKQTQPDWSISYP